MTDPLFRVRDLTVCRRDGAPIVDDVSFEVERGKVMGIVGESGSGKTTLGLALLGYARAGLRITAGSVSVDGLDLLALEGERIRTARGATVSYVPQDPSAALNPALRIERQLANVLMSHGASDHAEEIMEDTFRLVQLPTDQAFRRRYPHELSGGQQQRVALALALVCEPSLVVLDEPTTGLDVIVQARLLAGLRSLREHRGITMVFVSHDLAVVSSVADRVAVMYGGHLVETGPSTDVLTRPLHPYTRALVQAIPDHVKPRELTGLPGLVAPPLADRPPGCRFVDRCDQAVPSCRTVTPALDPIGSDRAVRCTEWRRTPATAPVLLSGKPRLRRPGTVLEVEELEAQHMTRSGAVVAAAGVSFEVSPGECLALVGESGSGKTTIARCLVGLHTPSAGRILFRGEPLAERAKDRTRIQRRGIQIVFQNPRESLNPRRRILDELMRPVIVLLGSSREEAARRAEGLLERVQLPSRLGRRYPHELSGGELQRVAIARALIAQPELLVCDEVTSSLDVSIQASILDLLAECKRDLELAMVFITHDLGVVANIADHAMVLERGTICESGPVLELLARPSSAYAQLLVETAPSVSRIVGPTTNLGA
jgi:peptide/nickel transport system ATP-binding protein